MSTATEHTLTENAKARRVIEDFRILDTERGGDRFDIHPAKEWATLRIVTWHDKDRRAYVSRVRRVMANDRGGYRSNFDLMSSEPDPAPYKITPTARYSAKELRAVHDDYVSANLGGSDQIKTALDWARKAVEA